MLTLHLEGASPGKLEGGSEVKADAKQCGMVLLLCWLPFPTQPQRDFEGFLALLSFVEGLNKEITA